MRITENNKSLLEANLVHLKDVLCHSKESDIELFPSEVVTLAIKEITALRTANARLRAEISIYEGSRC